MRKALCQRYLAIQRCWLGQMYQKDRNWCDFVGSEHRCGGRGLNLGEFLQVELRSALSGLQADFGAILQITRVQAHIAHRMQAHASFLYQGRAGAVLSAVARAIPIAISSTPLAPLQKIRVLNGLWERK